jgi:hypothetical protein
VPPTFADTFDEGIYCFEVGVGTVIRLTIGQKDDIAGETARAWRQSESSDPQHVTLKPDWRRNALLNSCD